MITRIVKLTFRLEDVPAFLELFEKSKASIFAFPGMKYLELSKNENEENIFFTISKWESEAALNAYRNSDFFNKTWNQTKQYFNDKPEAWTLGTVESIGKWQ
jgi:quinol monooxygenase YgiN